MSMNLPFTNSDEHCETKNAIFKTFESRKTSLKFIAFVRWQAQTRSRGIWNAGAICPNGHLVQSVNFVDDTNRYYCDVRDCRKLFSPVYGTLFEQSRVPLWKWFIFIILPRKTAMSGRTIAKLLKVSNKTGSKMKETLHKRALVEKDFISKIYSGIYTAINV